MIREGTRIAEFTVQKLLGKGNFAEVYLAHNDNLKRSVAIKIPFLASEDAKKRFLAESRMAASLEREGIVRIYHVGETSNVPSLEDGTPFVEMQYIEGGSLAVLTYSERLPYTRVADLMIKISEAVHYAHTKSRLVHRDLKPENILLDGDGNPLIADFGLAASKEALRGGTYELAGTREYMSPEQIRGDSLDGRSDIWSLGVILYRLLCGRLPFPSESRDQLANILHDDPEPLRQVDDSIPKGLEEICRKCLAKRVNDRYLTARDLADALRNSSASETILSLPSQFRYLQHVKEVLKIDEPIKAKWFRKTGAVAIDFAEDKVYTRHKLLDALYDLVLNNRASLLEGEGATGKTTLVRHLAYYLFNTSEVDVYFLNCELARDFDVSLLSDEIRTAQGVIILEDIHLETRKFQMIYSSLKSHNQNHILFIARPSFRAQQFTRIQDLSSLPSMVIQPFDEVDGIINHFTEQHFDQDWSPRICEVIKTITSSNLWLMSYALLGYVCALEECDPMNWLERGVREDLRDLHGINHDFPNVLVALSALFRNEVKTSEHYLTDRLGFSYDVLDQLLGRGEIIRQISRRGEILYGLPHSTLADAYWSFGYEYHRRSKLSTMEDFIYDYAISGNPNGLEAVNHTNIPTGLRDELLCRLCNSRKIWQVMTAEESFGAIASSIDIVSEYCSFEQNALDMISKKIDEDSDIYAVALCFNSLCKNQPDAGTLLWHLIDKGIFSEKLHLLGHFFLTGRSIIMLCETNTEIAKGLRNLLDPEVFAKRINSVEDMNFVGYLIYAIWKCDAAKGEQVWQMIDHNRLGRLMSRPSNLFEISSCICYLHGINEKIGRGFCDVLELSKIVMTCVNSYKCGHLGAIVYHLSSGYPEVGEELLRLLDPRSLARTLHQATNMRDAGECISYIYRVNRKYGHDLFKMIDKQMLVKRLKKEKNLEQTMCVFDIYYGNQQDGLELLQMFDVDDFVTQLNTSDNIEVISEFFQTMNRVGIDWGATISFRLDRELLIRKLRLTPDVTKVKSCVRWIGRNNKAVCDELTRLLNIDW